MPLSIALEPVDSLTVTTLVDNVFDAFMPDQGPAQRRAPAGGGRTLPTTTMLGGLVPDQLVAKHGLSLLLTVTRNNVSHQLL
ncbi:MAG: MBL fold metallo-hydrolase, partial [Chloroflexi bacterium]|nr:MBL fold metallo-hydrolase [Chloroflexota bacterium]